MSAEIKKLKEDDWKIWRDLRLEAVSKWPHFMQTTLDEEKSKSETDYRSLLKNSDALAALREDESVGIIGFNKLKHVMNEHRGVIFSLYLKRVAYGSGLSDELLEAALDVAKTKTVRVECMILKRNAPSVNLALRHGFEICAQLPKTVLFNNRFYDEYVLFKDFDRGIAPAMQHKFRIGPEQPRRIGAQREVFAHALRRIALHKI